MGFSTSRSDYLQAVRAEFERRGGGAFPEDVSDVVLQQLEVRLDGSATIFGGWLADWQKRRSAFGTLGDPAELLVQLRGSDAIGLYSALDRRQARSLVDGPLDVSRRVEWSEEATAHVRGGVVPFGKVLILDRVEVEGWLGTTLGSSSAPTGGTPLEGSFTLRINGRSVFDQRGRNVPVSGAFIGPFRVGHLEQEPLGIRLRYAAVSARGTGRILDIAEAAKIRTHGGRWAAPGSDGWLKTGQTILEVLADHGGGNPRQVRLDGTTYRIDEVLTASLWDESLDLRKNRRSLAYTRGTGLVPPDKVFRISRIDYTVRLDARSPDHSDFVLRVKGKKVVEITAKDDPNPVGTWTGPVNILPGEEADVEVICSYYGMASVTISGEIVDPTPR